MANPNASTRKFDQIAFLSYGFRPFFFFGSLYAALNMLIWLPFYLSDLNLPIIADPIDWHVHELLFGVLPAIVTGFLLTAIPNWTGRLPVRGAPLLMLFSLWALGRIAFNMSQTIGLPATAIIDCSFLLAVFLVTFREIIAGKNWRNLRVLIIIFCIAAAHIAFYLETAAFGSANISLRFGLSSLCLLIMLIGGRIIPSFTRNLLNRAKSKKLPTPFNNLDKICLGVSVLGLFGWSILPDQTYVGVLLIVAGLANFVRLSRWQGHQVLNTYILVILHFAYLFLAMGLVLLGTNVLAPVIVSRAAAVHALGTGAIGTMVLGVMVRATRGHTGYPLQADLGAKLCFTFILLSASVRVGVEFLALGDWQMHVIRLSQLSWCFAFLCFAVFYGPKLWRPRKS